LHWFCWGGALTNQLAVNVSNLKVAVPFYGRQPEAADVPKIKSDHAMPLRCVRRTHQRGNTRIRRSTEESGTRYEIFVYEGAQHAFNNDTAPTRYNEAAAKLAWSRAIALFKIELI